MLPHPSPVQEQLLDLPADLRPVVQYLLLLRTDSAAAPSTHTLLPSFQATLLVNLGAGAGAELWWPASAEPPYRLAGALLLGPHTTALRYRLPAGARVLSLNFTLAGFYQLFQVPAAELRNTLLDPALVLPPLEVATLLEQLAGAASPTALPAVVAAWCQQQLRPLVAPHAALLAGLPSLSQPAAVQQLAAATGCTPRTLQLRFRHYLGFSAQEARRFLRFRRLLAATQGRLAAGFIDWFEVLTQHGYYDQSHLIRDFQHFLHQSPRQMTSELHQGASLCLPGTTLGSSMAPNDQ